MIGLFLAAATAAVQLRPEYPSATVDPPEAAASDAEMDARWERLQREREAAAAQAREARERYERELREAEAARARYEAETDRHRAADEEAERRQAEYEARLEAWRSDPAVERAAERPARREHRPTSERRQQSSAESCERQTERNRARGRLFGRIVGTAATALGAPSDVGGAVGNLVPAAELLGEAIAGLLDCEEQEKAAAATEEAVRGGVGTTAAWQSESRPGVSGSSTVTAMETQEDGAQCMTVTDIVIVDGEETRAPKRLCRSPGSDRFVRV